MQLQKLYIMKSWKENLHPCFNSWSTYNNFLSNFQTVSYEADERGFKPQISYEDSADLAHSGGYDNNANNPRSNQDSGYNNHAGHGHDNGYGRHGNGDSGYSSNHGNGNPRSNGYWLKHGRLIDIVLFLNCIYFFV